MKKLVRNHVTGKLLLIVDGHAIWYRDGGFRLTSFAMKPFKFAKLKDAVQFVYALEYERQGKLRGF